MGMCCTTGVTAQYVDYAGSVSAGERGSASLAGRYDGDDAYFWTGAHGVGAHFIPHSISEGKLAMPKILVIS